jgi:hypothetical protein
MTASDAEVPDGDIFTEEEAAARYKVTSRTFRRWRYLRSGPVWFPVGRLVRYRRSDLLAWEQRQAAMAADPPSPAA